MIRICSCQLRSVLESTYIRFRPFQRARYKDSSLSASDRMTLREFEIFFKKVSFVNLFDEKR